MVELERRGEIDELKALIQSVPSQVEQIAGAQSIGAHYRGQMEGDLETGEGGGGSGGRSVAVKSRALLSLLPIWSRRLKQGFPRCNRSSCIRLMQGNLER